MRTRPPVARRIARAREAAGLSREVVAQRVGLTVPSYWHLETTDDDAFMTISLTMLTVLGRTLGVSPRELVDSGTPLSPDQRVSLAEVSARIRDQIALAGGDADAWGETVGWDVTGVLSDPQRLEEFNLDGLVDVCSAIGMDWRGLVPE